MVKIYERGCSARASRYLRRIPLSEILHGIETKKEGYLHHESRILCEGNRGMNKLIKNVSSWVKDSKEAEEFEQLVASSPSQVGLETG